MTDGEYQRQSAPPAPPYGTPHPETAAYVVPAKNNGLAIASLVLGILWIYWIGSILALVFGYMAKNQIDRSGGTQSGRGLAIAGIVLGWVGVGILLLLIVLGIALGVSGFGTS
jgi:hypothetical protein